jgi:PPP family 3-phenylpropionic acid transporter
MLYFLYFAAWASLLPFLPLYYQSLGFSAGRIGLLTSIPPLVNLVGAPFWGGLADATRRHRHVLLVAIVGAALGVTALSQISTFGLLASMVAVYAFFNAPIVPLIDNSVLTLLGERRERYGAQRLWGAIGWGMLAPVVGWLAGAYGFRWAFATYLGLTAATALVAWRFPIHSSAHAQPFWSGARALLLDRRWVLFLATIFLSGIQHASATNYLFLYMDELGASQATMGLALTVASVSELPVLFYSGWLVRRWGPHGLLALGLTAATVRALSYSIASAPWQVLIVQCLHGLSFSAMWVASVSIAGQIAPQGLGATAQALFSSTMTGFGAMCGALINGFLFERLGGAQMFRLNGVLAFVGLALFALASRQVRVRPRS